MKVWRKILKGGLYLAGSLFLLLLLLLCLLWWKPGMLLNERNLRRALGLAPEGMQVSWKTLDLKFPWKGLSEKGVVLELTGFCLDWPGTVSTCIPRLSLSTDISLKNFDPRISAIHRLQGEIAFIRLPPGPEKTVTDPLPDLRLFSFAGLIPVEMDPGKIPDLSLVLSELTLESREGPPLLVSARLIKGEDSPLPVSLTASLRQDPGLGLDLQGSATFGESTLRMKGKIRGKVSGWKISSPLSFSWGEALNLQARPRISSGSSVLESPLKVDWSSREIRLALEKLVLHGENKIKATLKDCLIHSRLNRAKGYPADNEIRCGFRAEHGSRSFPALNGQARMTAKLLPVSRESARLDFTLEESGKDSMLESSLKGNGEAILHTGGGNLEKLRFQLDLDLKIPEFMAWTKFWENSPLAVPAPLNRLRGTAETHVQLGQENGEKLRGNLSFSTVLKSPGQIVNLIADAGIEGERALSENPHFHIESRLNLKDLMLEAPPLTYGEPPQFLPDDRFVTSKAVKAETRPGREKKGSSAVSWNLRITQGRPVRIVTNLLQNPVPLGLDLRLASVGPPEGFVEVLPMPLQLFEKKAQVEKIRVSFPEGSTVGELNGLVLHRSPEVTIRLLILGSTEEPRFEFQSDPPLAKDQILAVLLFNKSLAELSEEEASSAQNMGQAISEGAFGLFSLFFLASTPIQSVGYDPVTQTYSARVSLDSKTTVSVGSDLEETRKFGLRRRIGGRWAVSTELRQEQGAPDEVLSLIEWFKRF